MVSISVVSLIIYGLILLLSIAWTLLLARIIGKAGFNKWWVLVTLVPFLNLIFIWVFAFVKWPTHQKKLGHK